MDVENTYVQHARLRMNHNIFTEVSVIQGDTDRELHFLIDDYEIPTDSEVRIYIKKPSGLEVYKQCEIVDGEVVIKPSYQMFLETGRNIGQLQFVRNQLIISSFTFFVNVNESVVLSSNITSSNEYSILDHLIFDARAQIASMQNLYTTVDNSETVRGQNEAIRIENEEARISAETSRQNNTSSAIQSTNQAAQNANSAAQNANSAAQNASQKASLANEAASNAQTQANAAQAAAAKANAVKSAAKTLWTGWTLLSSSSQFGGYDTGGADLIFYIPDDCMSDNKIILAIEFVSLYGSASSFTGGGSGIQFVSITTEASNGNTTYSTYKIDGYYIAYTQSQSVTQFNQNCSLTASLKYINSSTNYKWQCSINASNDNQDKTAIVRVSAIIPN